MLTVNENFKKNIPGLDCIRAVACLWVFIHHLGFFMESSAWSPYVINFIKFGNLGVSIFFVLSGFLLSLQFWNTKSSVNLKSYLIRRFARIVPAYYLCVIILVIANSAFESKWEVVQFLMLLTFTNTLIAAMAAPDFNTVIWTIPIETYCYLLLPLIFLLGNKIKNNNLFISYLTGIICLIFFLQTMHVKFTSDIQNWIGETAYYNSSSFIHLAVLPLIGHFMIGVLAGNIFTRPPSLLAALNQAKYTNIIITTLLIVIFLSFPIGLGLPEISSMKYYWPTFPLIIAGLIYLIPKSTSYLKFSELRFFKVTANLSYGIYLWHLPVLIMTAKLLNIKQSVLASEMILLSTSALLLTYLIAFLSYRYLEKPLINWSKKF